MKQRGRKSTAELATVTRLPGRFLEPPTDLAPEEAEVWSRVVAKYSGDWFDAGSEPLLAAFCRATVQSEVVGEQVRQCAQAMLTDPDQLGTYKELRKIQAGLSGELVSLGRSMRLTQQARYRADKADTTARRGGSGRKPWQTQDVIDA